jgi:hypothetical protein
MSLTVTDRSEKTSGKVIQQGMIGCNPQERNRDVFMFIVYI